MDNPKMGVIGGGCIAVRFLEDTLSPKFNGVALKTKFILPHKIYLQLALGLGFGLFGPCGLLTFISISTFILLRLP